MKPILFNTDMVQAILDGRKTVTRRIIKNQPSDKMPSNHDYCQMPLFTSKGIKKLHYMDVIEQNPFKQTRYFESFAPYEKGDTLYVRETWRVGAWNEDISSIAVDYMADGYVQKEWIPIEDEEEFQRYWIQSTDDAEKAGLTSDENGQYHWKPGEGPSRWRPSIHMPKEAARIFLRVTDVRLERLQDISVEQAKREGAFHSCSMCTHWSDYCGQSVTLARDCKIDGIAPEFPRIWDSTIDIKNHWMDYSWGANPWVWVIEFERISKDEVSK